MPLPTFAIPAGAGLLSAYVGAMKLLASTMQWQLETMCNDIASMEHIYFPDFPTNGFFSNLPPSAVPIPLAIISRPFALPYRRGTSTNPNVTGDNHYQGALILDLNLAVSPIYLDEELNLRADVIARMEICIDQMRNLREHDSRITPSERNWNFTSFEIFHRTDWDTGEPEEIGRVERGQAWDLRDWKGKPLGRPAWASSWVLEFGY